jgi:DNA excision repair protein ERCC-2
VPLEDYFAYDTFRPGQRELSQQVYESCIRGGIAIIEAPSGFGKTAAVLGGTLSAAITESSKIIYCCRTKRQIHRVVEEVSALQKRRQVKAAALSSKFDYCLLKETSHRNVPQESFGWYCGYHVSNNLCGYFLNIPFVGKDLDFVVQRACNSIPTHSQLMKDAERLYVCPYELTRMAAMQADIIVVPYQYVFDVFAKNTLSNIVDSDPKNTILVIDEAHNLRDFLRSTYTAKISTKDLDLAINEADQLLMSDMSASLGHLREELVNVLHNAPGWLLDRKSLVKEIGKRHGGVWLQNLAFELNSPSTAMWNAAATYRSMPRFILKVGDFVNKLLSAPNLVVTKSETEIALVNSNPVEGLGEYLSRFRSSILVSATMSPSALFIRSLGINMPAPTTYTARTGDLIDVMSLVDTGVTTKYKLRSPEMYNKIARRIQAIADSTPQGLGVFVPSYAVLEPIFEMVSKELKERCLREEKSMSVQDALDLMEAFKAIRRPVLFGVQGGRFSEGEDFKGDAMGASLVVGLSIPPPSPLLYAEYAHLRWMGESDAYLMLCLLPALRKAFQAAGRHLRAPGKRGMVFLMDKRFDSHVAKELLPSWLSKNLMIGDFAPAQLGAICSRFWSV